MRSCLFERITVAAVAALALGALPQDLAAHHGWGWATDKEFEITGKIIGVRLGNPHGEVTLAAVRRLPG